MASLNIPIHGLSPYVLPMTINPVQPANTDARQMARDLMQGASFAALGVLDPDTGSPFVSRISFWMSPDDQALSLISGLAFHARALKINPTCSVLLGEPPSKGDPLAFPRLTLQAKAFILPRVELEYWRNDFLKSRPKAQLYIDLADFRFLRFETTGAFLNAGFGKAFNLSPEDLTKKPGR